MNWLKKTLARWVDDGHEILDLEFDRRHRHDELRKGCVVQELDHSPDSDPTMNFKVYNANGGKVVEFRQYDRVNDRSVNQLYIIPEDRDFGDSIKHIAMLHLLSTQK